MKIYTNKNHTTEVVSKYDLDESPTKFRIGLLTTTEREAINELLSDEINERTAHKVIRAVIELGLKGWDRLPNEDGDLVVFKTVKKSVLGLPEREVISPDLYDLPHTFDLWNDLASKIRKFNSLSKEQEKN